MCKALCIVAMLTLLVSKVSAWDQPTLVSDKVGLPENYPLNRLIADSTQETFDLQPLNGVAYLFYAEWDEFNYRRYARIGAYNQHGELWNRSVSVPSPFSFTFPSQVKIWRDKIFVIGQITFENPWSTSPFIARFDTMGNQEWFTVLITPTADGLLWGPQLSISPVSRIGMVHFTTNTAKFQLINMESGEIVGSPNGYFLPLYGSIGYCSMSYRPAWLNGAWWFIHKDVSNTVLTITSVNPQGTVNSTPVYWSYYSSDGVFPATGDSLAAILPNFDTTQLTLSTTSLDGFKGSEVILAPIPSNIWGIYDSRKAAGGMVTTVLVRQYSAFNFSADVTIVGTGNEVIHTLLPFDMLPASCQAELIGEQTLGVTRSVRQNLIFAAINLNDGTVIHEDIVGPTSPVFSSINWSNLCGDQRGGAFVAWYVEEGTSFAGHLYLQWVPRQISAVDQVKTSCQTETQICISPNPFNPTTAINYQLPAVSNVTLKIYDLAGRVVAELVNGRQQAGAHYVTFDGTNLPSGVYLCQIIAGDFTNTQKLMLVK